MSKDFFHNLPKPSEDALPHHLKDLVVLHGKARLAQSIPVGELLANMFLHKNNAYFTTRVREIMNKTPNFADATASRATQADFRQFIRDMINAEGNNIMASLRNLREQGLEKEYQSAVQGWAKFGFGTEQKVDINVGIEQKRTLVQSINDEYAYSEAIDTDFEESEPASIPENVSDGHSLNFQGDAPSSQEETPIKVIQPAKKPKLSIKERMKQYADSHPNEEN